MTTGLMVKRVLPVRKNARSAGARPTACAGDGVPVSRRARRAAETRERIYQAALGLFAERGFAAITVEDITDAADVGKGTFFNYFPSKEHVLIAFSDMQLSKLQESVDQMREGREPMREFFRSMTLRMTEEPAK